MKLKEECINIQNIKDYPFFSECVNLSEFKFYHLQHMICRPCLSHFEQKSKLNDHLKNCKKIAVFKTYTTPNLEMLKLTEVEFELIIDYMCMMI